MRCYRQHSGQNPNRNCAKGEEYDKRQRGHDAVRNANVVRHVPVNVEWWQTPPAPERVQPIVAFVVEESTWAVETAAAAATAVPVEPIPSVSYWYPAWRYSIDSTVSILVAICSRWAISELTRFDIGGEYDYSEAKRRQQ
jgi:hypothetical protein